MRNIVPLLLVLLGAACTFAPPSPPGPAVTLLGERHDNAGDHRWQLAEIERAYAADPRMTLGFEMFQRSAQPVLDSWVAGSLSEDAFLQQTDWVNTWGFDPELYAPFFRFARDHHVPMLALNVSQRLVRAVSRRGWAAVPDAEREGVGTPVPATDAYRDDLAQAMAGHGGATSPAALARFMDVQLLWDRAMADAIAAARTRDPGRRVVALMGAGHVEFGWGVPHQLESLGVTDVAARLPPGWEAVALADHGRKD